MAEVTDDFVESLRAVRGEFQNTKGGRIGNRILAHVFSTFFPIVFISYLVFFSGFAWPLSSEGWLFIVFSIMTLVVGVFFHRTINRRFVFDDEGIQEFSGSGQLKQSVSWEELKKIEYRESRGIRTFTMVAENKAMQLEFYKSLSEAIAKIEKAKK